MAGVFRGSDRDQLSDVSKSQDFVGNPILGYKVAFCERDVAIYGSLLLFGLVYGATGRRLRAFPWYLWVLIGILPIAVDGFSQLPSLLDVQWPWLARLPIREVLQCCGPSPASCLDLRRLGLVIHLLKDSRRKHA